MYTKLIFKPTNNISREVAHIYEHEFINNFHEHLEATNINPGLIGWINGDTFDDIISIEAGFYDEKVAKLFDNFTSNYKSKNKILQKSLDQIQLEDGLVQSIDNYGELQRQFSALDKIDWADLSKNAEIYMPRSEAKLPIPIRTTNNPNLSKEVTIGIFIETNAKERISLFGRFSIIILDLINYRLSKTIPIYTADTSQSLFADSIAQRTQTIKISRQTSVDSLEKSIKQIIKNIEIDEIYEATRQHFEVFSRESLWIFQTIENYRTSGVIASNQAVARLATRKNLEAILEKLDFYVVS